MTQIIRFAATVSLASCCILTVPPASAATIDAPLQNLLAQAAPTDTVTALLVVDKTNDIGYRALQRAHQQSTAKSRYATAMHILQTETADAQEHIMQELRSRLSRGELVSVRQFWISNVIQVRGRASEIALLRKLKGVAEVAADIPVELIAPVALSAAESAEGAAENLEAVGVRALWNRGLTGDGRLICSIDTGVDGDHPALVNTWKGHDGNTELGWFDPRASTEPNDASGHGTHVMGIMVGHDGADTIGVAPGARWMTAGVIDRGRTLSQTISDILSAFEWAANPDGDPVTMDDVPDVICNSWGIPKGFMKPCDEKFWDAIDNLEALGIVCVFAAGNEGPNSETIRNPATRASSPSNSFAVGAVNTVDLGLRVPDFSSRGPSTCDFSVKKPEIVAPGVGIRSSYKDGTYKLINGTSMAAPHVAAAIALFRQYNPDLTPEQMKSALLLSAIDIEDPGEDNESGMGMIDLAAAFELLPAPQNPELTVSNVVFQDGQNNLFDSGDQGTLQLTVQGLFEPGAQVTARLSSQNSAVNISNDSVILVFDEQGDALAQGAFDLTLSDQIAIGDSLAFTLAVSGPKIAGVLREDLAMVAGIPYNGKWDNLHNGTVGVTLSNFGLIGLHESSNVPVGGIGYHHEHTGSNFLYEAGLVLGAGGIVVDELRNDDPGTHDGDFKPLALGIDEAVSLNTAGGETLSALFDDADAVHPLGVSVRQEAVMLSGSAADGAILIEWTIFNESEHGLDDLTVGFFSDWDIPGAFQQDLIQVNAEENLYYQYRLDVEALVGVVALNRSMQTVNFYENGAGKRTFSSFEKQQMLQYTGVIEAPQRAADWCGTVVMGPYDLAPGDSAIVAFALCSGTTIDEFYQAAAAARDRYAMATGLTDEEDVIPDAPELVLYQNYPNPFNPDTRISFETSVGGQVSVAVYDVLGRRVSLLLNDYRPAGRHVIRWMGRDDQGRALSSGIYFTRVSTKSMTKTRKMVLLK